MLLLELYDEKQSKNQSNKQRDMPYPWPTNLNGLCSQLSKRRYFPIKDLTQFVDRYTAVKGRFTNVENPRTYSNSKGEGKIWKMELVDSSDEKGTIRCTLFNRAVDKFLSVVKENNIFSVSRFTIKPANRKFNSGLHDFELHLGEDAEIKWEAEDDASIPTKRIAAKITYISELSAATKDSTVNICGIVIKSSGKQRNQRHDEYISSIIKWMSDTKVNN